MQRYDKDYYQKHTDHFLEVNLEKIPSFAWMRDRLEIREGDRILDAGCGTGYLLNFICGGRVGGVGVDVSEEAIKTAKKRFPRYQFVRGDLTNLPFEDEVFDKIICFNTIEHIQDQDKAMWELRRILKLGGTIVLGTNVKDSLSWRLFKLFCGGDPTHTREFRAQEFVDFVRQHLQVVEWTRSSCIARFPMTINRVLHQFLKGDVLVKAVKG